MKKIINVILVSTIILSLASCATQSNNEVKDNKIEEVQDIEINRIDEFNGVRAGDVYEGKVTKIIEFGIFVEILPGVEGLVPSSQLGIDRTTRPADVFSIGDKCIVKVTEILEGGKIGLSIKKAKE